MADSYFQGLFRHLADEGIIGRLTQKYEEALKAEVSQLRERLFKKTNAWPTKTGISMTCGQQ